MKKENIVINSELDFVIKMTNYLHKEIDILNKSDDPYFDYIKISIPNYRDIIFIRLLPTQNYFSDSIKSNFVNIYINHDQNKKECNSLISSFMYIDEYFDMCIKDILVLVFNSIFKFEDNTEYKLNITIGTKTSSYVNLNKRYPRAIEGEGSFVAFLHYLASNLTTSRPSFDVQFYCNVNGNNIEVNNSLNQDGEYFLVFTYDPNLSYRYSSNIVHVYGKLPTITTDDGVTNICDILDLNNVDDFYNYLQPLLRWYFSLRDALLDGESVEVYTTTIPYFQEYI